MRLLLLLLLLAIHARCFDGDYFSPLSVDEDDNQEDTFVLDHTEVSSMGQKNESEHGVIHAIPIEFDSRRSRSAPETNDQGLE